MVDELLKQFIFEKYGFTIVNSSVPESYFSRVSELITEDNAHIMIKFLPEFYADKLLSYQPVLAVCEFIKNNFNELETITHLTSFDGNVVQKWEKDTYFVLMEKHEIVSKGTFTSDDQRFLGYLMSIFHKKLMDFNHLHLSNTRWMRKIDEFGLKLLEKEFDDRGFVPYLPFTHTVNYSSLKLELITIHGDWHRGNFSFTRVPFLFDFDTLSRGAAVEDIARTLTQWSMNHKDRKTFFDNFIQGYVGLSDHEIELIPRFMIAQLYANYVYFFGLNDQKNADETKVAIPLVKSLFKLD